MNPKATGLLFIAAALLLVVFFIGDMFFGANNRQESSWSVYSSDPADPDTAYQPLPDLRPERPRLADLVAEQFEREQALTSDELKAAHGRQDYIYTVQNGDVIDNLAERYLGKSSLKQRVFEANPILRPGAQLIPGTKLTIPFRYRED